MYTTSSAYKTAISEVSRTSRITGTITPVGESAIAITDADIKLGSLYLDEKCISGESLEIGNVYASELGVAFVSDVITAYDLTGATIALSYGIERDGQVANLVVNGNFANGTTAWVADHATATAAGNTYTLALNGTASYGFSSQNLSAVSGHKIYAKGIYRVTNSNCLSMIFYVTAGGVGYALKTQASPVVNQWYTMSDIITLTAALTFIHFINYYADAATANGKVTEAQEVLAIDLTAEFGAGNEPTLAWCDANFATWFDGTVFNPYVPKVWEDIPLGIFYVTEVLRGISDVTVKALDGMILFDMSIYPPADPLAHTVEEWVTDVCNYLGLPCAITHAQFITFANQSYDFALYNVVEVCTGRDILMWCAQLSGVFFRVNRAGELTFVNMRPPTFGPVIPVRSIVADERYAPTIVADQPTVIGRVLINVKGVEYYFETFTGEATVVLGDNPFMWNSSAIAIEGTYLNEIHQQIGPIHYTPFKSQFIGDPSLETGDYVQLDATGQGDIIGLVTSSNWRYRGKHLLVSSGKNVVTQARQTASDTMQQLNTRMNNFTADMIKNGTMTLLGDGDDVVLAGGSVNTHLITTIAHIGYVAHEFTASTGASSAMRVWTDIPENCLITVNVWSLDRAHRGVGTWRVINYADVNVITAVMAHYYNGVMTGINLFTDGTNACITWVASASIAVFSSISIVALGSE